MVCFNFVVFFKRWLLCELLDCQGSKRIAEQIQDIVREKGKNWQFWL
jgi:hypothetical protein